jgi:hypothetical protein
MHRTFIIMPWKRERLSTYSQIPERIVRVGMGHG